jgi:Spy/CpxP family protein refolding chaperone
MVTAVERHQSGAGQADDGVARYDVSVKVANTIYTVLYTPPNGANGVEYSAGLSLLVLVGNNTLTFNSKLSGKTEVPILRRETLASKPGLDLSKLPSQYFSMKQEHLADALDLTNDQQSKIKPILEQEAGEAGQVLGNPAISRKDQLNRWEKIVQSSDTKIEPVLSPTQVQKLQALRQEQKQELKKLIADQKSSNTN